MYTILLFWLSEHPEDKEIMMCITNLVGVMEPAYTIENLIVKTNIFSRISGVDQLEISIFFKHLMQVCKISEQLNQGYLDEFLGSIEKCESSIINSNYL